MPLPGPSNAQPVHFRLAIALLLALLVHSAGLIALVHSLQHLTKPLPATAIHLRLTAPAHQESQHSATRAEQPAASPPSPAQPRQPDQPAPTTTPEPVVTSNSSHTAVPPQSQPERAAEATTSTRHSAERPKPSAKTPARSAESPPSSTATASQAQAVGTPVEAPPTTTEDSPAQTHADPVAKDPYVALLWQRISTALSRRPVHSISELQQVRVVRLELQLMDNGTLIQLQTLESSGDPALDRAARQGALAASPYPVPPSSARDQDYRYQVELRFTPRRS